MLSAPAEKRKIKLYSGEFYGVCAVGGMLSCGLTHTAVTPLDVVKCNMQIDPKKYKSIAGGFSLTAKEAGLGGLVKGWVPTLIGYSVQGAGKFGLYEFFKQYVTMNFVLLSVSMHPSWLAVGAMMSFLTFFAAITQSWRGTRMQQSTRRCYFWLAQPQQSSLLTSVFVPLRL